MPDLATPLLPYVVLYTKPDFNAPDAALFYAQDSDNAERIFEATVPDGEIFNIFLLNRIFNPIIKTLL